MRNYMLSFNAKEASDLRSALHIAVNLLAVSGYSDLLGVRQTANNLHRMMVGWGVPLHPEVLAFESMCHGAFAEAFKKEEPVPVPKPEPMRWEVQVRKAGTSNRWVRSAASSTMKDHSRAEAYRALRRMDRFYDSQLERRVAEVGDNSHVPGTYRVEARFPSGSWRTSDTEPTANWSTAWSQIEVLKTYASSDVEFRTVFTPDK